MYPAAGRKSPTRRYASDENVIAEVMNGPEDTLGFGRKIWLGVSSGEHLRLPAESVQAVVTDPPYFDFVQYGDLLAVHSAWIRAVLPEADLNATALPHELTVKPGTIGRGAERFAEGLSATFRNSALALVDGGLFAFTYHHSRCEAYVPLVVALLDAGLTCTLVLPYVAEMVGSLHIRGRKASSVDSLFICRKSPTSIPSVRQSLEQDLEAIRKSGHDPTASDFACVRFGRGVVTAAENLRAYWDATAPVVQRLQTARTALGAAIAGDAGVLIESVLRREP
jgi:adenine-specific DNA methylase